VLAQADQHSFSSLAKRDLVVRVAPGAAPVLLDWSPATGYQPAAASAELDRAIAADAIVRTLGALRDDFEEHEDIESFLAVMAEGVARAPGTPDLLRFAPFLMKHDGADVVRTIADAHIQAAPRSAVGYYWKAQLLVEAAASGGGNARIGEAAALLQQAVTLQPDYPDAQGALANVARLQGDEAKAEQTLRAILQNHPKHPEANYTLGLVLLAKNPAEALACFELGEQGAPNDPDYPRSKARALLALKRIPEARVALQRARSLSPDDPRIEQVAAQLAGQNPVASAMKWIIRLVVLALLAGVGLYVYKLVSAAKPPAAATPAAPAKQKPKTK
jgi:tetratricopeptide (TPR) repeat protein